MYSKNLKPRILLVSATVFFGGGEVYYRKLAKLLLEHYEVAAVVFNPVLQDEFEKLGIRVWRGDTPPGCSILKRYFVLATCLWNAMRRYGPNLVHLNGGPETFLAAIPKLFGVPTLITYHTYTNASEALHKRLLLSLCMSFAKKVICVSATVQNNLHEILWADKTIVITNWLDFVPERSTRTPFDGTRELSLLFVGRIEAEKGVSDLLEAMKLLEKVHLNIVGDGSYMTKARERSINLPVTFHGFKGDVAEFYRNADLFVLPSLSEGQSLVLIEAMSYGVPCIISDIPAPIETAGNGQFALIFKVGDAADMANKIRTLQNDPAHLRSLSENGRRYALQTYSEDRVRPMYYGLVQSVLRDKQPRDAR